MRVFITYKVGADGQQLHTRHYIMAQADFDQLRYDILAYLNQGASALRGASYRYRDVDTNQERELLARFDDILYIESGMPEAGSRITRSLHSRLAGAGG